MAVLAEAGESATRWTVTPIKRCNAIAAMMMSLTK